ncbi:zinc finger protein 8 [Ziziphus jujuba]|uniref:Zinc finger protein 8 n=2 Tax=Ziziphus jujuba TaxID=326968 RepID=A0A6P4A6S5_ZIZJJ|nr:zinc finger protein 8 [Ziziphus jujuba]KAH7517347.1 hypothetical protein FEM48_Zijuj09G0053900 [Ziziphus jujuba var. spinosa]
MESNYHHEEDSSKSSSEDTDRSEQNEENHEHTGSGRSYECVFCKRGFTTAQALGGHMNIHRKDRAKTRPYTPAAVSTHQSADDHHHRHHHNYANISPYRSIQGYPPHDYYSSSSGIHVNYQTYIPASTWGLRPPPAVLVPGHDFCPRNSLLPDLSREDYWRGIRTSRGEDDHNTEKINGGCSIDLELDLELRLGHDP